MRFTKSVPVASAAVIVVLGCVGMPAPSVAESDKFKITCNEVGDAPEGTPPKYTCTVKGADAPKKPKAGPVEYPKNKDFDIDMDKLMLFPPREGADQLRPLACPGWFFINGKWRYFSTPPCPWRDENETAGGKRTK